MPSEYLKLCFQYALKKGLNSWTHTHPHPPFQIFSYEHMWIKQEHMSLWDPMKEPPPDLKGKTPLHLAGVFLRVLWFLPNILLSGRGTPT